MSSRRRPVPTALLGVMAMLGALAGCGDDGATTEAPTTAATSSGDSSAGASSSPSAPADAPACAETWQAEAELPRAYRGCVDDAGAYVKADRLRCSSGQAIVRYDDRWYAVPGGTIHEVSGVMDEDQEYLAAVRTCRA